MSPDGERSPHCGVVSGRAFCIPYTRSGITKPGNA